jgi:ribosomal protein S18 acetylase RimI-like enzyme
VIVRPVQLNDYDAWRRLFLDYGVFYETSFDDDIISGVWAWLMAESTHESKPERALVAEVDGTVVGFTHYREQADTFTAASGWFLDDLYVSPEARGKGIAQALIDGVVAAARAGGGGTVRWITAHDNHTAQSVYDKTATRMTWVTYEKES